MRVSACVQAQPPGQAYLQGTVGPFAPLPHTRTLNETRNIGPFSGLEFSSFMKFILPVCSSVSAPHAGPGWSSSAFPATRSSFLCEN